MCPINVKDLQIYNVQFIYMYIVQSAKIILIQGKRDRKAFNFNMQNDAIFELLAMISFIFAIVSIPLTIAKAIIVALCRF